MGTPKNERWPIEKLLRERENVLNEWPTGKEAWNLEESFQYQRQMESGRKYVDALRTLREKESYLITARTGVATIEEMIELHRFMKEEGTCNALTIHADSFTRWHQYEKTAQRLEESKISKKNLLNGFPYVIHGVQGLRRVTEAGRLPVRAAIGTLDPRLGFEIAFAAGCTEANVSTFTRIHSFPNNKIPVEQVIDNFQYAGRLIGYYQENGISIVTFTSGCNAGFMLSPSISLASAVVESLLNAEQGVKHIKLVYYMNASIIQDLAAARLMKSICKEYLNRLGYGDVQLYTAISHWNGPYPVKESCAYALSALGSIIGVLSNCDEIVVKSIEEGKQLPSKEANAASCRLTRYLLKQMGASAIPDDALEEEMHYTGKEVKCLLDNIERLGEGDFLKGTLKAYEIGQMEWPFSGSKYNQGNVLLARDDCGAVRFLDHGNLPFTEDIIQYHRTKLTKNLKKVSTPFQLVAEGLKGLDLALM